MQAQAEASRPTVITWSFWLLLLSGAIAVVGTAISIINLLSPAGVKELRDTILATPGTLEGELDVDTLVGVSQATAIGVQVLTGLVSLILVLWIAFAIRGGRRYIRIVATVLVTLQAFGTAAAPSATAIVNLGVVIVAVALAWTAPASRYIIMRNELKHATRMIGLSR